MRYTKFAMKSSQFATHIGLAKAVIIYCMRKFTSSLDKFSHIANDYSQLCCESLRTAFELSLNSSIRVNPVQSCVIRVL
jgi:hypothetical protein